MSEYAIPRAWADAEQIDGADVVDKTHLVGVPLRITGIYFQLSRRGIQSVFIDAETASPDLPKVTFTDSSTGIKEQIKNILIQKEKDHAIDSGEYVEMNLVAPRGLRFSEYEREGARRGEKLSKTYYLTASGTRGNVPTPAQPEAKTPTRAARTSRTSTPTE